MRAPYAGSLLGSSILPFIIVTGNAGCSITADLPSLVFIVPVELAGLVCAKAIPTARHIAMALAVSAHAAPVLGLPQLSFRIRRTLPGSPLLLVTTAGTHAICPSGVRLSSDSA